MSHDDGTGEESDDAWESHELSEQVGEIPIQKNETGLFDGMLVDWLVHLEQIAQPETTESAECHAEEEQVAEV